MHQTILKKGSGIPIVFLHGFLGSSEDWKPLVSFLPNQTCIGYDLPGHGKSNIDAPLKIDLETFHLVGYSLGGRIALQQFQKKALSLTLLSTHPGLKNEEEKQKRWLHDQKWADRLTNSSIEQFLQLWYDQPIFCGFRPDFSRRKNQNVEDLKEMLLRFSLAKQERFFIDEGVVGEKDLKFRSLYQNPIVIRNAGHMLHLEKPEELALIIDQRTNL